MGECFMTRRGGNVVSGAIVSPYTDGTNYVLTVPDLVGKSNFIITMMPKTGYADKSYENLLNLLITLIYEDDTFTYFRRNGGSTITAETKTSTKITFDKATGTIDLTAENGNLRWANKSTNNTLVYQYVAW